jgi:hypothetical protein
MDKVSDDVLRVLRSAHSTSSPIHSMATELLAYRQSGALEALRAVTPHALQARYPEHPDILAACDAIAKLEAI